MKTKLFAILSGVLALSCGGDDNRATTTTKPVTGGVLPPASTSPPPPSAAQAPVTMPAAPPASAVPDTGTMTATPTTPPAGGAGAWNGTAGAMAPSAGSAAMPLAGAGEPAGPSAPAESASATEGSEAANAFCDKYGAHCGYGMPQRHADRAACLADFDVDPLQQACKNMHLDTAIAGTAAACNGMPSDFCFAIHCLHAAGITDPTGVTYCKSM